MKESLGLAKKDMQKSTIKETELKNRIALIEAQLREKQEFYESYKSKNWEQNQRNLADFRDKVIELEF